MLHQRRIKLPKVLVSSEWMLTVAKESSRDLQSGLHLISLPHLLLNVSAERAVYYPDVLRGTWPCCWRSTLHREGIFLLLKDLLLSHSSGLSRKKVPTELPSGHSTTQRPPTEGEEVLHCVFLFWDFGWSVCLAVASVPVMAAEQRGRARGRLLWLYSLGKCVC